MTSWKQLEVRHSCPSLLFSLYGLHSVGWISSDFSRVNSIASICAPCALNVVQLLDPTCPSLEQRSLKSLQEISWSNVSLWEEPNLIHYFCSPVQRLRQRRILLTEGKVCQSYGHHEMDERGLWHSGNFQRNNPHSYPPWILPAPWLVKTCCTSAGSDFFGP